MRKKGEKKELTAKENKGVIRSYFLRLFGKYDIRHEEQFVSMAKWTIFIVLVVVEAMILLDHIDKFHARGGWDILFGILLLEFVLTLSEALKFFIVKNRNARIVLYILDGIAGCGFTLVTQGTASIALYILVLTEFYIGAEHTKPSLALLISAMMLYEVSYVLQVYLRYGGQQGIISIITEAFSYTFAMVVHFLLLQVALAFYRQFIRLDKALKELDESKKELEKAYEAVAEVTALEERQRIAKEIHDTAGHSITTVIMQTEAAKLIIDDNPEDAKQKLVAANLQAKHALEELRDSVHLLSGAREGNRLKIMLEDIVRESTDGTGITIRSAMEDIEVSPVKQRLICNTLKEGISNGLRHGGATAFWFELKREGDEISFLLSDNGKGVTEDGLRLGFGLSGMRDRAASLGGRVAFNSETDEGFEICMYLPV